jgi:hypothetical protein
MQVVLAMFRADNERRSFSVSRDMTVVGRREDCDIRIPLGEVSRKHCRIIKDGDSVRLEDLGSSNGTYHNGQRIQETVLSPGDNVQVGPVTFVVQIDGVPADEDIQPVGMNARADSTSDVWEAPDEHGEAANDPATNAALEPEMEPAIVDEASIAATGDEAAAELEEEPVDLEAVEEPVMMEEVPEEPAEAAAIEEPQGESSLAETEASDASEDFDFTLDETEEPIDDVQIELDHSQSQHNA